MRPSIAPLVKENGDVSRSRSETASSSASLRQRRQGFVPSRKPTGDLKLVPKVDSQVVDRSSQASTIKAIHNRATSSISSVNSYLATSSAGGSSGLASPVGGIEMQFPGQKSRRRQLVANTSGSGDAVKSTKRLLFTLGQLRRPMNDAAFALKPGSRQHTGAHDKVQAAQSVMSELDMLFHRLQNSVERGTTTETEAMQAIVRISVRALKCWGAAAGDLKRHIPAIVKSSDGIVVRCLMFQLHSTMVELKNVCSILGFKVRDKLNTKERPRISQAWSNKSLTPTQPKPPVNRRMRNGTHTQHVNSPPPLRNGLPPPPVPLSTNISRTNTLTSLSAATPRSGDTFQIHESVDTNSRPLVSRTNTMRSMIDAGENDEQFEHIFLKLKHACDLAAHALPHCRAEFSTRRDIAQSAGQRSHLQLWTNAVKKCELAILNNKALKKRLELVKASDLGVKYQRDFWQLCDGFVHVGHLILTLRILLTFHCSPGPRWRQQ